LPLVLYVPSARPFSDIDFQHLLSLFQDEIIPTFLRDGAQEGPEFRHSGGLAFDYHFRETPVGFAVLSRANKVFDPNHYDGGAFVGYTVSKSTLYVTLRDPLQEVKETSPNVISHFWRKAT